MDTLQIVGVVVNIIVALYMFTKFTPADTGRKYAVLFLCLAVLCGVFSSLLIFEVAFIAYSIIFD